MLCTNDLIEALARNVSVVKMQTQGLTHADTLIQPHFGGNCLNWVLGHIVENRDRILELIGQKELFLVEDLHAIQQHPIVIQFFVLL